MHPLCYITWEERKRIEFKLSIIHSPCLRHFDHTLVRFVCDEKENGCEAHTVLYTHSSSLVLLMNSEQIIRAPPANQGATLRQSRERAANRKRERTLEGRGERGDKEELLRFESHIQPAKCSHGETISVILTEI